MNLARSVTLALVIAVSSGPALMAQDFGKGLAAADAGDFVTALNEWKPLAEQGFASAQFNLGIMYNNGQGVLQDYREAMKWYRPAAEQGHASAQYNLGVSYYYGEGIVKDNLKAHMWFNIAASNGAAEAATFRANLAKTMTAADISKAQSMARDCMNSGYKNCGW